MKKVSGMAVQFLLILAALFSSAAAKTEAGKKVCVEHEADNVRTTSVVRTSIVFVYNDDILVSMRFLLNWKLHISVQVGAFDIWYLLCFFLFLFVHIDVDYTSWAKSCLFISNPFWLS